jgi:hypothetical protein
MKNDINEIPSIATTRNLRKKFLNEHKVKLEQYKLKLIKELQDSQKAFIKRFSNESMLNFNECVSNLKSDVVASDPIRCKWMLPKDIDLFTKKRYIIKLYEKHLYTNKYKDISTTIPDHKYYLNKEYVDSVHVDISLPKKWL